MGCINGEWKACDTVSGRLVTPEVAATWHHAQRCLGFFHATSRIIRVDEDVTNQQWILYTV
jgi:hypothetical protein